MMLSILLTFTVVKNIHAGIPQHFVKRGNRIVKYDENHELKSRFWTPSSDEVEGALTTDFLRTNHRNLNKKRHSTYWYNKADRSWHIHVYASGIVERKQRRLQNENISQYFDETMHQSSITGQFHNETYNISTSVEFGIDGNRSSNLTTLYSDSDSNVSITLQSPYQPMRIRVILSQMQDRKVNLTDAERRILFSEILSPSILAWSAALRVNPVVGNLTVDSSQLIDGVSCGPGVGSGYPSVIVPSRHIASGLSNTDFIVYLSLGLKKSFNDSTTDQNIDLSLPEVDGFQNPLKKETITTADFSSFGSNLESSKENYNASDDVDIYCKGNYLAAATYCSTDQNDRPTTAMLHLCIDKSYFGKSRLGRNILTVMHELGHALGFNPQAMAHFRDSNGTAITKRDKDGNVVQRVVECAGPQSTRRFANVTLPSNRIVRFRNVRGGVRVAEVVTPSVKQVVRNHFDCQDLVGAELESGNLMIGETETTSSCLGDHWERRLFRNDLMNSIIDDVSFSLRISSVTLALFADSGWYQVDLSRTAYSDGWGRGAGCSFIEDDCISHGGAILKSNEAFFCNQVADTRQLGSMAYIQGCSPDMSRKAMCSISHYNYSLPSEFQYFNNTYGDDVGGNEPLIDYCPVYSGFSDGICKEGSAMVLTMSNIEVFGVRNSRCLSGVASGQKTGLCVEIACVVEDKSLRIKVNGSWKKCDHTGQEYAANDGRDTRVFCPDVIRACPTFFCNNDCLGTGGTCNFSTGQCMCSFSSENVSIHSGCDKGLNYSPSIFFSDPLLWNESDSEPNVDEFSPLADYYVSNERLLTNRRDSPSKMYAYLFISLVILGSTVLSIRYFSLYSSTNICKLLSCMGSQSSDLNEQVTLEHEPQSHLSFRANKDKFVAALLLHLRIQNAASESQNEPGHTSSETNSSIVYDSDDQASDYCPCSERSASEQEEPAQVIRRRFLNSSLS
jgi:Leishmanolysin